MGSQIDYVIDSCGATGAMPGAMLGGLPATLAASTSGLRLRARDRASLPEGLGPDGDIAAAAAAAGRCSDGADSAETPITSDAPSGEAWPRGAAAYI